MLRKIVARIVVPFLSVFISLATLCADDPTAPATIGQRGQPLKFIQLFQVGQHITFSSSSAGNYSLRIYDEEQKKEIQSRYEKELAEYEKHEKDRKLVDAKGRELMQELRNADPADRDRIMAELRGIGRAGGAAGGFGGFAGRGAGREAVRVAAQARTRRPSSVRFYRVSEIGTNYVGLIRETRQMCIPVWSIRSVSRDVDADDQDANAKPETSTGSQTGKK